MLQGRSAKRSFRRACGPRDEGQMLLLTSVILLIGFIALSSMVIRVTQLPDETTQDSRKPVDLEADAVAEGVKHLLLRTHERVPITDVNGVGHADYAAAVEASLGTLVSMEQGRGFRFSWTPVTCDAVGSSLDVDISVTVTLEDLDTRVRVTVTESFGSGDPLLPYICTP